MANTTNFGWETPDDTDLVKDGAAAMRTLGNSIDSSFVDLKGGTTGQILSKNSNTDLDYIWINNDQGDITAVTAGTGISGGGTTGAVTITNSMATEITASGDIIVGTGSGTFDNLPIGTTGQVLTADTTVSPYKVKWATVAGPSAWTSFTPTITAQSGTITTYSAQGYYVTNGSICVATYRINLQNVGTAAGNLIATLPITAATKTDGVWIGAVNEFNQSGKSGTFYVASGGTTGGTRDYAFATWFVSAAIVGITITYEV